MHLTCLLSILLTLLDTLKVVGSIDGGGGSGGGGGGGGGAIEATWLIIAEDVIFCISLLWLASTGWNETNKHFTKQDKKTLCLWVLK